MSSSLRMYFSSSTCRRGPNALLPGLEVCWVGGWNGARSSSSTSSRRLPRILVIWLNCSLSGRILVMYGSWWSNASCRDIMVIVEELSILEAGPTRRFFHDLTPVDSESVPMRGEVPALVGSSKCFIHESKSPSIFGFPPLS